MAQPRQGFKLTADGDVVGQIIMGPRSEHLDRNRLQRIGLQVIRLVNDGETADAFAAIDNAEPTPMVLAICYTDPRAVRVRIGPEVTAPTPELPLHEYQDVCERPFILTTILGGCRNLDRGCEPRRLQSLAASVGAWSSVGGDTEEHPRASNNGRPPFGEQRSSAEYRRNRSEF